MNLKGNLGNLAVVLIVVVCTASAARGDLVFTLASASSTVNAGEVIDVNAALDLTSPIDLVQMGVFFDATLGSLGFDYHPDFVAATTSGNAFTPDFLGQFVDGIGGDFAPGGAGGSGAFPIGTFGINTTGMLPGAYSLMLDSASFTQVGAEPALALTGNPFPFTVTSSVVPAPGAFLLGAVGLGFVGWFRRRTA